MASYAGLYDPPNRRKLVEKYDKSSEYDFLQVFLESY